MLSVIDFKQSVPDCPANLAACYRLLQTTWLQAQYQLDQLRQESCSLQAKLQVNSQNSSLSPSSDSIQVKAEQRKEREINNQETDSDEPSRKQGAQPGHIGKGRLLFTPEEVDKVIPYCPDATCQACKGKVMMGEIRQRKQIIDIIEKRLTVTEHQFYGGKCSNCKKCSRTPIPSTLPKGWFDASVLAFIAAMTGKYRLSKSAAKDILYDIFGLNVSIGTISNAEHKVSAAVVAPVEDVAAAVTKQDHLHLDETSYPFKGNLEWLWLASNKFLTYFKLQAKRNQDSAKALIGEHYQGMTITDRYGAYGFIPEERRQYCWAHLKRDIQRQIDNGWLEAQKVSKSLEQTRRDIFEHYYQGQTEQAMTQRHSPLRNSIAAFYHNLRQGCTITKTKMAGFCRRLIKERRSLWHFLIYDQIDPTNNHAERQLRHSVIWRKISYGTQSERGKRYVERVLTIVKTCQQQGKNVIQFIQDCVNAHWMGGDYPTLVG